MNKMDKNLSKPGIFVSYSNSDKNLVTVSRKVISELGFNPIVIADRRQMSKALTDKVINGLFEADYFLPILTENSINAQWINQEIGFAKMLELNDKIKIYSIVEDTIIDSLKGFMHKNIDLPYTFIKHQHNGVRSKNFKRELIKLLSDLKQNLTPTKNFPLEMSIAKKTGIVFNTDINKRLNAELVITIENSSESTFTIRNFSIDLKCDDLKTDFYNEDFIKFDIEQYRENDKQFYIPPNTLRIGPKDSKDFSIKFKSQKAYFENLNQLREHLNRIRGRIQQINATIITSNNTFEIEVKQV
jgi:hypothetical protein